MAARRLLYCAAAAALMLSSCIYPFEPGIETADNRIVIEGSVSIGGTSTFTFSRVVPFTAEEYTPPAMYFTGYIEGEDGSRINSAPVFSETKTSLQFDTPASMPSQRYRVHFDEMVTGAAYESDWMEVSDAPVIDDLRYILDYNRNELNVALSMHCNGYQHFRWYYDETWEYHSELLASHYLDFAYLYTDPERSFVKFTPPNNIYYCWKSEDSPNIKIFSTAEQVEDRFTDLEFHRVPRSSNKLQVLYRLVVHLEAIDENAYLYWKNIDENTNNQGSIFSPVPSQMPGNIHCLTDPDAEVIGYINASRQVTAKLHYNNVKEDFYNGRSAEWADITIEDVYDPGEFYKWYLRGYLPFTFIPAEMSETGMPTYQWATARCVDCRRAGGNKNRPADWPNNDY